MPDLTLDEINRLRALEKAATPGPYYVDGGRNMHGRIYCGWTLKARHPDFVEDGAGYQIASIGGTGHPDADAERLCALANAAPALLDMAAECLRLRDCNDWAKHLLRRVLREAWEAHRCIEPERAWPSHLKMEEAPDA